MPDDVIRLEKIRKVYRTGAIHVEALRGVSLAFPRSSFTAIMGPSGSGKSTLLNLIGCLDRPSSGHYFMEGKDVARLDDDALSDIRLHHLGFIFQSFNLIPQLTVQENVELPLVYLDHDPDFCAVRAREMLHTVGLSNRLHHRPSELSGGQQQRVAVARALTTDPSLILADEPTGNLDSATGIQIMELLTALNKRGRTIVMVTHENDIAAWAGRRVHMRDGQIHAIEGGGA
ncbi:MAG: ABC transporter ATP-binding protein [Kiritimatiellia bacterium]